MFAVGSCRTHHTGRPSHTWQNASPPIPGDDIVAGLLPTRAIVCSRTSSYAINSLYPGSWVLMPCAAYFGFSCSFPLPNRYPETAPMSGWLASIPSSYASLGSACILLCPLLVYAGLSVTDAARRKKNSAGDDQSYPALQLLGDFLCRGRALALWSANLGCTILHAIP